jgi:hypothetical protein
MIIQDVLETISNYPLEQDEDWQLHDLVVDGALTSVLFEVELRRQIILLDTRGAVDPSTFNCVVLILEGVLQTEQQHVVVHDTPIYAATVLDGGITETPDGKLNLYLDGFLHTKFSTGLVVNLEIDLPDVQVDYGDASADEVRRTSPRVDSAVVGEAVRVWRL